MDVMSGPPQCLPSPRRVGIPARAGLVRGKKAEPKMSTVSGRIFAADAAFAAVRDFYLTSRYGKRRGDPSICDLTFGNPHEMPLGGLVATLRERALPKHKDWFAYKTSEEEPQTFLAQRLRSELALPFEPFRHCSDHGRICSNLSDIPHSAQSG